MGGNYCPVSRISDRRQFRLVKSGINRYRRVVARTLVPAPDRPPTAPIRRSALFTFPETVDERAARLVAAGVVLMGIGFLLTGWEALLVVLAFGFVARVASGPRFSPLALLVTRVVVPRLPGAARAVPGPPKRFAQGIGATLTVAAVVAAFGFGAFSVARVLVVMLVGAAGLEAGLGFCLGCRIFAVLMKVGVIPSTVCERCDNLWGTPPRATAR